jgi:hypothetical protein
MTSLGGLHAPISGTPWGLRKVEVDDPARLRLFFLSLLWRTAASDLPECSEVELSEPDLAQLGGMLIHQTPDPLWFYPASLTQLSSIGAIHNMTPIAQTKHIRDLDGTIGDSIPFFRFYFDGLVAHIHRHPTDDATIRNLGTIIVGSARELTLSTVTYEGSFERENLSHILGETFMP